MQRKHIPSMGPRYWVSLSIVSVFGANLGDFSSHDLHLGHAVGLLPMAAFLGAIFITERRDHSWNQIYYWLAIIVIRAAATNLADLFTHDFGLGRLSAAAGLTLLLALALFVGRPLASASNQAKLEKKSANALPTTDTQYWTAMMIAGTLGTVIGDYSSFGLHLGTGNASLMLGALLAAVLLLGSRGLLATMSYYWLTIVMVRAAGTAVGDFLAGSKALNIGLPLSTLCTGLLFVATAILWQDKDSSRLRSAAT